MISSVNTNSATVLPVSKKSVNGSQNTNFWVPLALDSKALTSCVQKASGGCSGWMNASVYKSENFSADNPVMLVKGTNVDGKSFEIEININDVSPKNASFVEMLALQGYYTADGQHLDLLQGFTSPMGISDAFSKFDFLSSTQELMEIQRINANWDGYMQLKLVVDSLLNFNAKK